MSSVDDAIAQVMELLQAGNAAGALKFCRTLVTGNPESADAHYLHGVTLGQVGRIPEGISEIQRAIELDDDVAAYHFDLGNMLHACERFESAVKCYRRAIELEPDLAEAHFSLATTLGELQQFEEAIEHLNLTLKLEPRHPLARGVMANHFMMAGDYERARMNALIAIKEDPENSNLYALLGQILLLDGRDDEAAEALKRACTIDPENADAFYMLGEVMMIQGRAKVALRCYDRALERNPMNAAYHAGRGQTLQWLTRSEEALECYERAVQLDPDHAMAVSGLAVMLQRSGKREEASRLLNELIERHPDFHPAYTVLASVYRQEKQLEEALATLDRVLARELPMKTRGLALTERGQTLDKMKRFEEAFASFEEAQELLSQEPAAQRAPRDKAPRRVAEAASWLDSGVQKNWPKSIPESDVEAPIFFVGFPRSGTTLVEQMLASHPHLVTTDEAPLVSRMRTWVKNKYGQRVDEVHQALDLLTTEDICELRRFYYENANELFGEETFVGKRIVDKHPLNLMSLAFVRRIFPDAKLLVAIRDPRDACLSCFMQYFKPNFAMVQYFTMESTVRFYTEVMGLWLRFRDELGLDWMESKYEELIADTEGRARKIIEFIGEPWDDCVLEYHARAADRWITTPSYHAVSQPIYQSAMARWKNYQWAMAPFQEKLAPFCRQFGYEPG